MENLTPGEVPVQNEEATPEVPRVFKKLSSTFTLQEHTEPDDSPLEAVELYIMRDYSSSDDDSIHYEETSFDNLAPLKSIALSSTYVVEKADNKVFHVTVDRQHDVANEKLKKDIAGEEAVEKSDKDVLNSFLIDSFEGEHFSDVEMAVDFFDFETVPLSPVVDDEADNQEPPIEVPISAIIRRTRLYSLMSTPNKEAAGYEDSPGPLNESAAGLSVEWLEASSQNNSHGYGGSGQTSLAASSQAAKTSDSAVFLNEDTSLEHCLTFASIVENYKRHGCSHEILLPPIGHDVFADPCRCQEQELKKQKGFTDDSLARVMESCPSILRVPSSAKMSAAPQD